MTIDVQERAGARIVQLEGQLVGGPDDTFFNTVTEVLEAGTNGVIVGMGGITFMNSAGLSQLVRLVAQANTHEQRIILAELSPHVEGVLQVTKLDKFFELTPSVDEALRRLQSPSASNAAPRSVPTAQPQ